MLMNKSNGVVACCIAGLSAAFGLGVWLPESRNIAAYQQRIVTAQEALGPSAFQPAMVDRQLDEVERLREELHSSERYVPEGPELASVMRSLTQAVEAEGVSGQRFQTMETKTYKHYAVMPVELEFEDSFTSVYGVLERIETMPRLVRVESLNLRLMEKDNARTTAPRMQASLRLSGFHTGQQEGGK